MRIDRSVDRGMVKEIHIATEYQRDFFKLTCELDTFTSGLSDLNNNQSTGHVSDDLIGV